jgi:hypothetical protein
MALVFSPWSSRGGRTCRSTVTCRCQRPDDGGSKNKSTDGNSEVQDALADIMRLNVGKLEAIERLDSVTNDEKLKLIQRTDEVCTEPETSHGMSVK